MKKWLIGASLVSLLAFSGTAAACTFSWQHYGDPETFKRIEKSIGSVITNEYCKRFNSKYEIVIITDAYTNGNESLGNASVGFRKRGSTNVPVTRWSGYQSEKGNFVVGKGYDLAAAVAVNNVRDVMSALDKFIPN